MTIRKAARGITDRSHLARLIPPHMRAVRMAPNYVEHDVGHMYRVCRPDYDRMPIDTFLIDCVTGTGGRVVERCLRIVKPNRPELYPLQNKTDDDRLLYMFWANGHACKRLAEPKQHIFRHIVLPSDPNHAMMAAFKLACDHRRAMAEMPIEMPATICYRALGLDAHPYPFAPL